MPIDPEMLLEGPRGRFLCVAVAIALHQDVWSALHHAAWHVSDPRMRRALVDAVAPVDPASIRDWTDPLAFTEALDATVSQAMGWQEPHEEDRLTSDPAVIDALRPIAEAVAASPAAAWWDSDADLDDLVHADRFDERLSPTPLTLDGAPRALATWRRIALEEEQQMRREGPDDPTARPSGTWWSTPSGNGLVTTTRRVAGGPPAALLWEEDGFGQRDAILQPVRPLRAPRVYEIDGPDRLVALAARYPLEVSASRRYDWFRVTGRDGAWVIPDWEAVARDWDAVHLSMLGYLRSATRALAVDEVRSTVLAGWDPDETYWLTDVLTADRAEQECWSAPVDSSDWLLEWRRVDCG